MSSNEDSTVALQILYLDEHLVAVAKPSGMFVHRSEADRSATQFVVQTIRDQLNEFVFPLHRLDRATSGIVLLARSSDAAAAMGQLFSSRQISKTYLALVRGFCAESGFVDTPLVSSRGRGLPVGHPHAEPQEAETQFNVLERYSIPICSDRYPTTRCSLVSVQPVTGRYHQIRRHFNYISHPVIGDTSHGDSRQNRFFRDEFGSTRLMLAAVKMEFTHPLTGESISIDAPPESSFENVVTRLAEFRSA